MLSCKLRFVDIVILCLLSGYRFYQLINIIYIYIYDMICGIIPLC